MKHWSETFCGQPVRRFGGDRIEHILDYWAAAAPDRPAVWERGVAVCYADLQTQVATGRALLTANGVTAGDRVMIVAENCLAEIALFFAASGLRTWPVIVNARMSEREIEVIRSHCRPRLSIFTSPVSSDAALHAARAGAIAVSGGCFAGVELSTADDSALPESRELADQVATLIYTSGTTGAPKGVMVTHAGLLHFCAISSASRHLEPRDCVYAALPLSHIFGIATVVLSTLYAGASLYLELGFTPERAVDALVSSEISILQGVPILFRRLLTYLQTLSAVPCFPRLRYLYTGGGPLNAELKAEVETVLGLPLHHGYGMTEYAGSMFTTRIENPRSDCSSGVLNPGCAVRLLDADGTDVSKGGVGEIWVRGPGTMLGYYHAPDITRQTLTAEGWLNTGDTGRIDPDGALFVVGRTKDLIKRSGFNVYPIEVEWVLNTHPAVKSSAVVGRSMADGDEEIVAFVELQSDCPFETAAVLKFLTDRLAPYKRPARIIPIDPMPINANGKILKHQLKSLLSGA